jgi:hypothetical protein
MDEIETGLLDLRRLAEKVEWEGGVFATLRYGVRSDDIADETLKTLWAEMERHYRAITPIAVRIAAALEKAA